LGSFFRRLAQQIKSVKERQRYSSPRICKHSRRSSMDGIPKTAWSNEDWSETHGLRLTCCALTLPSLKKKELAKKVQGKSTATEACLRRDTSLQALLCNYFKLTSRSGLGQNMLQVIFGRLISGVGGAGINCLVSIVIAGITKATTLFFKANRVFSQIYCR